MGQWKDIKREKKLRAGIWGDYSLAYATVQSLFEPHEPISDIALQLSIPALPSFPIATPVPFSFHVETETKVVRRSDRPEKKPGKPLFPAPPTRSSGVTQELLRITKIRTGGRSRSALQTFNLQGSRRLGDVESVTQERALEAVIDVPEWIPKKGQGPRHPEAFSAHQFRAHFPLCANIQHQNARLGDM
jgi:hypothetical protein